MKFTGELRIPEVDHPGIPATVVIEDTHIEIVLDGEPLGKWSLYDVRARRLISKAFALDLAGDDVTFLADEPVDFAYRGVERMAQVWAQFKTMRGPQRMLAVRKSRSGALVSRVPELRSAMEANLEAHQAELPKKPVPAARAAAPPSPPPTRRPATAGEPGPTEQTAEPGPLPEVDASGEERARLEALQKDAVERDSKRVEAFRAEMAKLEGEQSEAERRFKEEENRLRSGMEELKADLEKARAGLATADDEARADINGEIARLETERIALVESATELRVSAERVRSDIGARRAELERMEAERWQAHRREMERIRMDLARLDLARPATPSPVAPAVMSPETEPEEEPEPAPAESAVGVPPPSQAGGQEEEDGGHDELVEQADESESEEEPVLVPADKAEERVKVPETAGGPSKSPQAQDTKVEKRGGMMSSVRSAFNREGKSHEHVFAEAPGITGITRHICKECGYVSIATDDD